jgi:Holliday junction resolvasome RuvABC endonuclease subunit
VETKLKGPVYWPRGKLVDKFAADVRRLGHLLRYGSVLAIDPASISVGWAYFENGELKDSGTFNLGKTRPINLRLQDLLKHLQHLPTPDVLVLEQIKGPGAYDQLKYAVGVTQAAVVTPNMVLCPIPVWKAYAKQDENYTVKGDQADAEVIGAATIEFSRVVS